MSPLGIDIENLDLSQLFQNHHVQQLFDSFMITSKGLVEVNKFRETLLQENLRLKAKLEELMIDKSQLWCASSCHF
jgi:hypothetical protein